MRRLRLVPDHTNINFMRYAWFWVPFSVIVTVISIALVFTRGLNLGVDFRGGALIIASTPEHEDVGRFREVLTGLNFGEVAVTEVSDDSGQGRFTVLMRLGISDPDANPMTVVEEVRGALTQAFPGIQFLQVDSVGSKVSGELIWKGVLAVLLSVAGIMIYIWMRFEWQFALGAAFSVLHDAIVTVGLFSLLQLEFNLTIVAAVLTVMGYSINDTVVIFDRVRELLRKYKKMPLPELMNLALNETLSRTVMTSSTTMLALFAIFFFGGDVVHGFATAMIFGGVIVGTYSTIYVACALVLWLGVRRDWSAAEKTAPART